MLNYNYILIIYFINVYLLFILIIYFIVGNMTYKALWSEFEVQALAFSILRKNLYPEYLVRGEYKFPGCRVDIAIFKAHKDKEPELKLIVEIKKNPMSYATSQGERYTHLTGVPCVYVRGGQEAYKVVELVQPYL